jgi:hypothetical protein
VFFVLFVVDLNLFESWTLLWVGRQQRFGTKNARTLRLKTSAQLPGEK